MKIAGSYEVVPSIDRRHATGDELEVVSHINGELSSLQNFVQEFEAGLALFHTARSELRNLNKEIAAFGDREAEKERRNLHTLFMKWIMISGKSCALTIWHFRECMNGVKEAVRKETPSLNAKVNWDLIREATDLNKLHFPHAEGLRHAVAHEANLTESTKKKRKHALAKPVMEGGLRVDAGSSVTLKSNMVGETYSYSQNGEFRTLKVNEASLLTLIAVRDTFYKAFELVEDARR